MIKINLLKSSESTGTKRQHSNSEHKRKKFISITQRGNNNKEKNS